MVLYPDGGMERCVTNKNVQNAYVYNQTNQIQSNMSFYEGTWNEPNNLRCKWSQY